MKNKELHLGDEVLEAVAGGVYFNAPVNSRPV